MASVSRSVASSTAAWTSSSDGCADDPPAAKWLPIRSPSRVTAVTSGRSATTARAVGRSSTTTILNRMRRSAGRRASGHSTTSTAYDAPAGSPGQVGVVDVPAAEQEPGPAEVLGLEVLDRPDRGVDVLDGDRVGGRAEGRGDRGLVAGPDRQQRGDRAEQAGHRVGGGEQGARAVLAVEAELQRLLAGGQRAALALGGLGLLAGLGEPVLDVGERGRRRPRARRRGPPPPRRARRPSSRAR